MQFMSTQPPVESEAPVQNTLGGKYLTFILGEEFYGIPVLKVREIIQLIPITRIPQLPEHIKGVVNLRGNVVPVVDLRLRFQLDHVKDTEQTCIIVVQIPKPGGGEGWIGLVVDTVEEVAGIRAEDIEPKPHFGMADSLDFILGMAKWKNRVTTLIRLEAVLSADTLRSLQSRAQL